LKNGSRPHFDFKIFLKKLLINFFEVAESQPSFVSRELVAAAYRQPYGKGGASLRTASNNRQQRRQPAASQTRRHWRCTPLSLLAEAASNAAEFSGLCLIDCDEICTLPGFLLRVRCGSLYVKTEIIPS
jgi:hypothetical protein